MIKHWNEVKHILSTKAGFLYLFGLGQPESIEEYKLKSVCRSLSVDRSRLLILLWYVQ